MINSSSYTAEMTFACRLAASDDPTGVVIGSSLGICVCMGLAVLGGRKLAEVIDEKAMSVCVT